MNDKLRLDDLLSTDEAVAYVNERLAAAGEPGVSAVGFRTHVHVPQYAQLEPIRLGERVMDDGARRNTLIVFTRRLLDEYVANRAHNRRSGAVRLVARPTAEETAQVFDTPAAVEYVNERIVEQGGMYTLTPALARYYRNTGHLPHRAVSAMKLVYIRGDLDAFAEFLLAESRRGYAGAIRTGEGEASEEADMEVL